MRYTVIYTPDAEGKLAALWIDSADPDSVTTASNAIEQILRQNPSLGLDLDFCWVLQVHPLEVCYMILEDDRIVRVFDVAELDS